MARGLRRLPVSFFSGGTSAQVDERVFSIPLVGRDCSGFSSPYHHPDSPFRLFQSTDDAFNSIPVISIFNGAN